MKLRSIIEDIRPINYYYRIYWFPGGGIQRGTETFLDDAIDVIRLIQRMTPETHGTITTMLDVGEGNDATRREWHHNLPIESLWFLCNIDEISMQYAQNAIDLLGDKAILEPPFNGDDPPMSPLAQIIGGYGKTKKFKPNRNGPNVPHEPQTPEGITLAV